MSNDIQSWTGNKCCVLKTTKTSMSNMPNPEVLQVHTRKDLVRKR